LKSLASVTLTNRTVTPEDSALVIKSVEIQKLANKAHICSSTQDIHVRFPSVFQTVRENPLAKRSTQ